MFSGWRDEHHGVPGLDEQGAKGAAHASGPDTADLERGRARRLGPDATRPSREGDHAKPAPGKLEKAAAAVISGVIPGHISLLVHLGSVAEGAKAMFHGDFDDGQAEGARQGQGSPSCLP